MGHVTSRRPHNRSRPRDFAGHIIHETTQSSDGRPTPPHAARALPPRLDARGRRRARDDDVERVAGNRRAGTRRREPAARARRQAGPTDSGRTAAGRPRRDDPRRRRVRPPRPRSDRRAGGRRTGRRIRVGDQEVAAARVDDLRSTRPGIEVRIHEYEPLESLDLLARDDVDLALVYDYDLAPAEWRVDHVVTPLWDLEWGIGVPTRRPSPGAGRPRRSRLDRELPAHRGRGRRCAPWPRAPASCRTSCTASTRSSSSTTSCWPDEESPSCRADVRRGAG